MKEDQDTLFEKILELAMKDKLVLWVGAGQGLHRVNGSPSETISKDLGRVSSVSHPTVCSAGQ